MKNTMLDPETSKATQAFMARIRPRYAVSQAIIFGSRARRSHRADSDADIAIVISGEHERQTTVAMDMAGIAFEVMLDTGVLIEALPLWEDEMEHPEHFSNPALIEIICREGIKL